ICISKALVARGHRVTVFSPTQGGIWDGVLYRNINEWPKYVQGVPHDVALISRMPQWASVLPQASLRFLWCHDLANKATKHELAPAIWALDRVFVLSEYQKRQYLSVHGGLPAEFFITTRNGIDVAAIQRARKAYGSSKSVVKLVYGSRPERGLEALTALMRRS